MDPTAEEARRIIRDTLQLSAEQHQQLAKLAVLVKDWNTRINLISRKDCSRDVVFGRHILPSLAPLALLSKEGGLQLQGGQQVCDVGTGGGFPGLPLAIARPDVDFLLVDSVGKKLTVVQDMADQLGLENVQIYHGRAESVPKDQKFDWVMGRSVAAIPTYCFWIDHLLKKKNQNEPDSCGHLLYLIGGVIDDSILEKSIRDEHISDLLERADVSDKRVLVFPQPAVHQLAQSSGEKLKVPQGSRDRSQHGNHQKKIANRRKNNSITTARGQWQQRDVTAPKQRGYEGFERFDSIQK
jgi:16S rRNA (guanine527-N7)-methyltransferase